MIDSIQAGRKNMTEKIPSLQGVRAIAFLSIFLYHITVEGRWGPYGVSIF